MKSSKFSLILMHDDGKAHRVRVGKFFFLVLTVLLLVLPILGGFGIWTGLNAWQYLQEWQLQQRTLEQALAECRLQAERLSNVVRLAGLSTETNGAVPAVATAPSPSVADTSPAGTAPAVSPAPATAPAPPPAVQPLPSAPDLAPEPRPEEIPTIDTGVLRLENVVARGQDSRKLRVSLDLYNAKPNAGMISGELTFALIDHDGKVHALDHDNTAFRITRFKKVLVTATVPDELASSDNAALLITATADDDEPLLRKIFPVESR